MIDKKCPEEDDKLHQSMILCAELDIAGEAIYQGIKRYESTEGDYYPADADTFYFLYQTFIGFERLIKIAHRLLQTKNKSFQFMASHDLIALNDGTPDIHLGKDEQKLLALLSEFYNKARYSHLNQKPESKIAGLRERLNKLDAVTLSTSIAHKYYEIIKALSYDIGIFVYELRYGSNSARLFYEIPASHEHRAFREFMIAMIAAHKQNLSKTGESLAEIEPLADIYENYDFFETLHELEKGIVPQSLIDTVDSYYDEVLGPNERKQREDMLEIFSANLAEDLLKDNEE